SAHPRFRPALPKSNNPVLLGLNAILALFLVLYFLHALAPEISHDGSPYHLGVVARYLREHGFVPVTTNMYAGLPQGMEMLFLLAFSFGRNSAAALVHFAFLVALAGAMILYSRRFREEMPGLCAAVLVFASPV